MEAHGFMIVSWKIMKLARERVEALIILPPIAPYSATTKRQIMAAALLRLAFTVVPFPITLPADLAAARIT